MLIPSFVISGYLRLKPRRGYLPFDLIKVKVEEISWLKLRSNGELEFDGIAQK